MVHTCKDEEIKSVIIYALHLSERYVKKIAEVYKRNNHPIPVGFNENDMDLDAPPLFTDKFYLIYIHEMAKLGLRTVSQAIEITESKTLQKLFNELLDDYQLLFKQTSDLLMARKVYPYAPTLYIPEKVDFIEDNNYLSGWVGKQRPLNAEEILRIHGTAHRNAVSKTLLTGFSKVVKDIEIKKYLERGIKNANQIIGDMQQILINENLPLTKTLEDEVYDSSNSPYSDKLILVHVAQMGAGSIGIYGTDLASIFRRDLGAKFIKMIGEALIYGEEGMRLLIKRRWIEEPPKN